MKVGAAFVCSLLLGSASLASAQPTPVSEGQQVLLACAQTYHSLQEFKGSAAVVSQSSINGAISLSNANADFDFVRGQHFDIGGYDSSHDAYSITSTPQKTTTKWALFGKEQVETARDVSSAVASFTGVAGLAPTTIPALLLETSYKYPFDTNMPATLKPSETFGGHLCFVVSQQTVKRPGNDTYWIDAKTFLLRGMREEQENYSFKIPKTGDEADKKLPDEEVKVAFSSRLHVFSIEQTLPTEVDLQAAARRIAFPAFNAR